MLVDQRQTFDKKRRGLTTRTLPGGDWMDSLPATVES
jgi:hypothetical protein